MELGAAINLIKYVLNNVNFNRILITTPNRTFNEYYGMEPDEMRHDDHSFELSREGFYNVINGILDDYRGVESMLMGIGDKVNGIYPTSACVIQKMPDKS